MADAQLRFVTSADDLTWNQPEPIFNGFTDYGLQMHNFRGELYGIMTQTVQYPKQLFATKYNLNVGWKPWLSLPEKFLSQGRASVTTLEDRFYVLRRGTNDAIYLTWTENFANWHDGGRIGSKHASTVVAPAICAHDGKLFMTGVGKDNYIYYTVADKTGTRLMSWKKIEGTGTRSALCMTIYDGRLWLFHTGWDNDKFFYQYFDDEKLAWSSLASVKTDITSGLSATSWKYNVLVVTHRGKDGEIKVNGFNGKSWGNETQIPNVRMMYQTGLTTWAGRLVVSYAATKDTLVVPGYKKSSAFMDEKSGGFAGSGDTDDEWECQWDESRQQKSWVKKLFCL